MAFNKRDFVQHFVCRSKAPDNGNVSKVLMHLQLADHQIESLSAVAGVPVRPSHSAVVRCLRWLCAAASPTTLHTSTVDKSLQFDKSRSGTFGRQSGNAPKAFVNILLFDKNHVFVDGAFEQVTSSGAPELISATYTVKEEVMPTCSFQTKMQRSQMFISMM